MIEAARAALQAVTVPWAAWHADATHELLFPAGWNINRVEALGLPAARPCDVARALDQAIDSPPLFDLARGVRRVAIAVDDLARPTRAAAILPHVLERLHAAGVAEGGIVILVATGTHSRPGFDDIALKVGPDVASRYRVEVHDPASGTVDSGVEYGRAPLRVNRAFLEADLKIGVGSVMPHPFAGYSGGAKLLLPGLADVAATDRSHRFVRMGLRGGSDPNQNGFRHEIEAIARRLGYTFTIACLANARRESVAVYAGDIVAAHRRACQDASRWYAAPVAELCDCLVLNAYPKDTELVQADGAFVALKTASQPVVRPGGVVVLATAASRGVGYHGLFSPGGVSYRPPAARREFADRHLWLYAPSLTEDEVRTLYWPGAIHFRNPQQLALALGEQLGENARAVVLPCAPLQQVKT